MKKKIKDLTIVDLDKICKIRDCEKCPLNLKHSYCYYDYLIARHQVTEQLDLEKEVEIDE